MVGDIMVTPVQYLCPANPMHSANVGLLLGQRRRRWPNINPTLAENLGWAHQVSWVFELKLPSYDILQTLTFYSKISHILGSQRSQSDLFHILIYKFVPKLKIIVYTSYLNFIQIQALSLEHYLDVYK